jgi:hypothetical protein
VRIISAIIALAKAVPVIDKWLSQLVTEFSKWKSEQIKKETAQSVDLGIKEQDQRKIEDEEHSGVYSGLGDIRSSLPGVVRDKTKD